MISQIEFLDSIGNPRTEDEAQISVGMWLAEQIDHVPASITYRCLGHHKGFSYCAYSDGHKLLGMTFANIADGEALIAPVEKGLDNATQIRKTMAAMAIYAGGEHYEIAAMCRDLVKMLGVDPLTYEAK